MAAEEVQPCVPDQNPTRRTHNPPPHLRERSKCRFITPPCTPAPWFSPHVAAGARADGRPSSIPIFPSETDRNRVLVAVRCLRFRRQPRLLTIADVRRATQRDDWSRLTRRNRRYKDTEGCDAPGATQMRNTWGWGEGGRAVSRMGMEGGRLCTTLLIQDRLSPRPPVRLPQLSAAFPSLRVVRHATRRPVEASQARLLLFLEQRLIYYKPGGGERAREALTGKFATA